MRILLYEYTCAVCGESALHAEGAAMLRAVAEDFAAVPDVRTVTLLANSLSFELGDECRRTDAAGEERCLRELAGATDLALVIAPETDGILVGRCRRIEEAGGRLLGSTLDAIALTADKLRLGQHWLAGGVPTPATWLNSAFDIRHSTFDIRSFLDGECGMPNVECRMSNSAYVLKPRFGAGSQDTFVLSDLTEAAALAAGMDGTDFIVQPLMRGVPASVTFLVGPAALLALTPARQHLSIDEGRLHYQGGSVPLPPALAERAVRLGRRAVEAVPGLRGYVGVDLVLGPAADGSADYAIEINPRLTTSYLGLRALTRSNLADLLLRVFRGDAPPAPVWRTDRVCFGGLR